VSQKNIGIYRNLLSSDTHELSVVNEILESVVSVESMTMIEVDEVVIVLVSVAVVVVVDMVEDLVDSEVSIMYM
jgi:hypothetical protein